MASCLLYKLVIQECQQAFGCKHDHHFPEIILVSYPFLPMVLNADSGKNLDVTIQNLQASIDKLKKASVQIIGIACNTLHNLVKHINLHNMQLFKITDAVLADAAHKKLQSLLVLATPTTVYNKIYKQKEIETVYPSAENQKNIVNIIAQIEEGKILQQSSLLIKKIIKETYDQKKFDGIVLGCTELPVLHDRYPIVLARNAYNMPLPILDSSRILAQKIVAQAFEKPRP